MKKCWIAALGILLALNLGTAALADLAYEPRDDFYEKHYQECSYENRLYYVNGPEGFTLGYSSPTGKARVALPNGLRYYVSWTYGQGEEAWGCIEYDAQTLEGSYGGESCWVKMSQLTADYDSESFLDGHAGDITEEDAQVVIPDYQSYVAGWKYPGSGIVLFTIGGHADTIRCQKTYTDSAGRQWGYCGYYQGYRQFWVCLDDPFNENLEPDENYVDILAQLVPAADGDTLEAALKEAGNPSYALIFGAVGVAAIAAAVLVYAIKKNRAGKRNKA